LHYYDNEKITKKKGSIDLENCEELRDRLDHNCYPYLFSLRTWDHGNLRTYFLAADNEAEMDKWVDKLAWVLNFSSKCTYQYYIFPNICKLHITEISFTFEQKFSDVSLQFMQFDCSGKFSFSSLDAG